MLLSVVLEYVLQKFPLNERLLFVYVTIYSTESENRLYFVLWTFDFLFAVCFSCYASALLALASSRVSLKSINSFPVPRVVICSPFPRLFSLYLSPVLDQCSLDPLFFSIHCVYSDLKKGLFFKFLFNLFSCDCVHLCPYFVVFH